ncbi:MAG: hypothetical protein MUC36_09185 [Planctomycetes bacterium]|jgi:hypothetical protein|nr:hypothetical protein [Planctomycetota bacterium]
MRLLSWLPCLLLLPALAGQSAQTLLLPDLLDLRPTADRLQGRLAELSAEAAVQAGLGNLALATQITGVVSTLQAQAAGTAPLPATPGAVEFHVVSFYEGFGATTTTPGTATIEVDRPGSAVALVLNAYDPIQWTITETPGTVVIAVISYSYEPQTLTTAGVPSAAVVQLSYTANQVGDYWGVANDPTDPEARLRANGWCIETLGAFAATMIGDYTAPSGNYVVGGATTDWREQWVLLEALQQGGALNNATRAQLIASAQVPFLPLLTPLPGSGAQPVVALATPLQTLAPLVALPSGTTGYALGNSLEVYTLQGGAPSTLSLATLQATPIPPDPQLPPFSFVNTITYDTTRDRLLVSGFGGGGNLYAFAPSTSTWTLLSQPVDPPRAIAYHPQYDATFGIAIDVFGTTPYSLQRYDSGGVLVGTVPITLPLLDDFPDSPQLYAYGSGVVYVGLPRRLLGFSVRQCFVIDPLTGDVVLATFLLG